MDKKIFRINWYNILAWIIILTIVIFRTVTKTWDISSVSIICFLVGVFISKFHRANLRSHLFKNGESPNAKDR